MIKKLNQTEKCDMLDSFILCRHFEPQFIEVPHNKMLQWSPHICEWRICYDGCWFLSAIDFIFKF